MFGLIGLVVGTVSILSVSYSMVVASFEMTEAQKKPANHELVKYTERTK